jgi:hypothetical protein
LSTLKNFVAKPGREFRPWAIWIWNQRITKIEIERQLKAFIEQGFGGIAVRPGRDMQPAFMSESFLDLFGHVLSIAKVAGIGIRIAEDFALPSAGVLETLAQRFASFRAQTLGLVHQEIVPDKGIFEKTFDDADFPEQYLAFTGKAVNGKLIFSSVKQLAPTQGKNTLSWQPPSPGEWMVVVCKKTPVISPEGRYIPNILNPKVAQAYIKEVLEPLKTLFSKYMPTTFEGFITEMPTYIPSTNGIPWDDDLVIKYKSKYKKEMLKVIPALFVDVQDREAKNRIHLYTYIAHSMYERFPAVFETWAKRFRLSQWVLTPEKSLHTEENISKDCFSIPALPFSSTGIQNQDGTHDSISAYRAHADLNATEFRRETITMLGRNRQGMGATLQSLKTEIENAVSCGNSRLILDGCFFNLSHHSYLRTPYNPSWYYPSGEHLRSVNEYAARLQIITNGLQANRSVAVLLPVQSMMADFMPTNIENARKAANALHAVIEVLEKNKISYDIISEERLLSCSIKVNGDFGTADRIRKGNYQALVIPYARSISRSLFVFVERLGIKKGKAIFIDNAPVGNLDDGITPAFSERVEKILKSKKEFICVSPAKDLPSVLKHIPKSLDILVNGKPCADLCAYHGYALDHEVVMIYSTTETKDYFATISFPGLNHVYLADSLNGEIHEIPEAVATETGVEITLSFNPLQCYTLCASAAKLPVTSPNKTDTHGIDAFAALPRSYRIVLKDQWTFTPESLNAMPLANWNTRIGLSRDSGSFSHFSESYFEVKEIPTECVVLLCGIPDSGTGGGADRHVPIYEISINGAVVGPYRSPTSLEAGASLPVWDMYCGVNALKYNIKDFLIRGFNRIAIRTLSGNGDPYPILYPPVIAGTFSISKGQKGWTVDVPETLIGYDSWTRHGFPYLSGCGIYSQKFELPSEKHRVVLNFSQTSGIVDVSINDVALGTLLWQPMAIDITGKCAHRRNDLTVRVYNSMDNLLRMNSRPSGLIGEVLLDVYENI